MSQQSPGKDPHGPKAQHGWPTEVTWDDGAGRQPYANQGPEPAGPPPGTETVEGDRGERSGRNLEQFEQVKGRP